MFRPATGEDSVRVVHSAAGVLVLQDVVRRHAIKEHAYGKPVEEVRLG